jgi:hypothetical protein
VTSVAAYAWNGKLGISGCYVTGATTQLNDVALGALSQPCSRALCHDLGTATYSPTARLAASSTSSDS